jgi:hypothetical protein
MFILYPTYLFWQLNSHLMIIIIIGVALVFTMGYWSSFQLSPFVVVSAQTQTTTTATLSNDTQSNNNNLTATLGDLIIDGVDKPTVIRVLDVNGPILEKSYTGNATIMGNISATYFGTLTTHPRSEGFTYSEGKAVITTEDGEMITHTSQGMGGFDIQTGKIKNHGSTFFSTTNSTGGGKLGFLNNMIGIWADEIDLASGIAHAKTWLLE